MKRVIDFAVAGAGLVLMSPVLAIAAIATMVDSGRPVLYRQVRIGRHFVPFTLYKFRTMHAGCEGPAITTQGDSRVTRVGRFLRETKLDETPQLVNVLRGDMSLVGPRPELPRFVEFFRPEYESILTVRPGITDLASIKYRDESQLIPAGVDSERFYQEQILPDKIAMAQSYVANHSLLGDLQILVKTLIHVISH